MKINLPNLGYYYKASREKFRESEIVAICAGTLVRVAYSYPKFAESQEGERMLNFAVETIAAFAAITDRQGKYLEALSAMKIAPLII